MDVCVSVQERETKGKERERVGRCTFECARERERDREYKRFSETSLKRFSEAMAI